MYVGYLLEAEGAMYQQGAVRRSGTGAPAQSFASAPQYADYSGYHHAAGADCHPQASGTWAPAYGAPRDDWGAYGLGAPISSLSPGQLPFCAPDYPPVQPAQESGAEPERERRHSYQWMRKAVQPTSTVGKTRTKEKYRVVYTDHQRLELEKEFHYNRYITIRRKSELAAGLGLSERQVKIWFQNRRAKERKLIKRKLGQTDSTGSSLRSEPGSVSPLAVCPSLSPSHIHVSLYPPSGMNNVQSMGNLQQVTVTQ